MVFACQLLLGILLTLVILTAVLRPSYTSPPKHYKTLRKTIEKSNDYGRANPNNEKIFIAASIYDEGGHLVSGAWGSSVLDLINLLGNRNVFLSIYENDGDREAYSALKAFEKELQCQHKLTFDNHLDLSDIAKVTLPDGTERVDRIAYLAEVRNRALHPLQRQQGHNGTEYDKVLFLNDIAFHSIEAVQLLFATNQDERGQARYLAACAMDFINPFKFYDTFATRDYEGYSMGVPFFPWFSGAGKGVSRQDVLDGRDAVRVKSCWGGMAAFDAAFFQAQKLERTQPLQFRAERDLYWEASECCLIHADLRSSVYTENEDEERGIYVNPFVRVAYSRTTLRFLSLTRRFERLYSLPHSLVNRLARMPRLNPRREEDEGAKVQERVWKADPDKTGGGMFEEVTRVAGAGGFCGMRALQVIKESPAPGERNWEAFPAPPI